MKSFITFIVALSSIAAVNAFAVQQPAAPVQSVASMDRIADVPSVQSNQLTSSFNEYLERTSPALESSSTSVSLQERVAPTAEEIAAKKRNFNLWFWGGGFVAPFLATFYYFGLKFWER